MRKLLLNSDKQTNNLAANRRRKKLYQRYKPFVVFALIVTIPFLVWTFWNSTSSVFRYVFSGSSLKQTNSRVNILLLGIGGGNHDGALLTDSIIVASYSMKTHNVTMFSVPRDLWLPGINNKINAAYEIGVYKNNGLGFAEDKIDDILGIPIHYGILMDFSGFSKAIDLVGGVDVNVPNTFDDYEFPIEGRENDLCGNVQKEVDVTPDQAKTLGGSTGKRTVLVDSTGKIATGSADYSCRFEHIHFDQGQTHLDGTMALKFVRSRHGDNGEGSDFARSKRQQLVIQAFRSKALSLQTLSDPSKIVSLFDTFGKSLVTDIPKSNFLDFYYLGKKVNKVDSVVLGDLGQGQSLFINPPPDKYGGAWVLIPPNEDFKTVEDFVKTTLEKD